ncbi:MAG: 50S ribosomal protein L20 [Dehalococcoidia bacterium]|nr:50S ribosomal protein L20 [Dehalococcoidia bacterium]
MPRVKGGTTTRQRHKKVLQLTKGHRASNSTLYRRAHESMLHSLSYSYRHRRELKRDMRGLWIMRINAAARENGMPYNRFMHGLTEAGVSIDRKMLADLAVRDSAAFTKLVEVAKGAK